MQAHPLSIGIACYPSVGGSGIIACTLGEALAQRGHSVHFISYERPFRLAPDSDKLHFHPVSVSDYGLFRYPDYTLPLSVTMAEVSRSHGLDVIHVHYAVPHATAALLACAMLKEHERPKVVTTLHGTDTTLLGRDPAYAPAIRHALEASDAVTTVSAFLKRETQRLLDFHPPIEVIPNFFSPRTPTRSPAEVRKEIGLKDELVLLHASNLRPLKRLDLLLKAVATVSIDQPFKLLILAGGDFSPYLALVQELGLQDRVIVREKVAEIEDYIQIADLGVFTSETESFCLSILEFMFFSVPSVAFDVGGIPEVVTQGESGMLVPFGDVSNLTATIERMLTNTSLRKEMGRAAQAEARSRFSTEKAVSLYEGLYRNVIPALPPLRL